MFTKEKLNYKDIVPFLTEKEKKQNKWIWDMKVPQQQFYETIYENKFFEICEDDGQQKGDLLFLREWDGNKYTGHWLKCTILYVWRGEEESIERGLEKGFCVIGFLIKSADNYDAL